MVSSHSVPLLITWVPKQLCQHPGSHQVTPSTPTTPPPPPPGLGNLEEPGTSRDLCVFQGVPHSQPTGPHAQSTELSLSRHQATHPVSSYSISCHQKNLCALPVTKQKFPGTDIYERERQRMLSPSAVDRRLSGTLRRSRPGRSLLSRGGIKQGLCGVKRNTGIYCHLFDLPACRWRGKKNVLEQLVLQQAAEKLTASEGRMGSGR